MKSVLLSNLIVGGTYANVISSDRFLIKILDRTISLQDISFQLRNTEAINCVFEDSFVIRYFEKSFIKELNKFVSDFPQDEVGIRRYLHAHEGVLKKIRYLFKMLRYSEDQKSAITPKLSQVIRESTKENKCNTEVLYKDTLKTNFINLLELELYLRSRYGGQLKKQNFDSVRSSIDLFIESLDKQFGHEYYW